MEYFPEMRINKLQLQATTWMDFINKMLSERSQTQKSTQLHDSTYIKFESRQNQSMVLAVRAVGTPGRG